MLCRLTPASGGDFWRNQVRCVSCCSLRFFFFLLQYTTSSANVDPYMQLLAIAKAGIVNPNGGNPKTKQTNRLGRFRSSVSTSARRSTGVKLPPSITQKPPETLLTLHQLSSPWAIARTIAEYSQLMILGRELVGCEGLCVGDVYGF